MNTIQDKPRIGVIGLGKIGYGVVANFLQNDYKVHVWNRSADKIAPCVQLGAIAEPSIAACVSAADIILEVTADDTSSRAVWLGKDGIIAHATRSKIFITSATLSIDWIDELAKICAEKKLTFYDMPVTGGKIAADTGTLTLLVGGDEKGLAALRPTLHAIAGDIKYFGPAGSGMRFKLILNGLQALHVAGFAQALHTAKKLGLDADAVGLALTERPGGPTTMVAWEGYKHPPEPANFFAQWMVKDLTYLEQLEPGSLAAETRALYSEFATQGNSHTDWTGITRQG